MKNYFNLSAVSIFLVAATADLQADYRGVPNAPIEYCQTVSQWWSQHRFNPESKKYDPDIKSPKKTIKLKAGEDIQSVINKLDTKGAAIILQEGSYKGFKIINKQNIHFIAKGAVSFSDRIIIYGCDECMNYEQFSLCAHQRDKKCLECLYNQPTQNIYFNGIHFEKGVECRTSNGVMWDNCSFDGPKSTSHAVNNNLWFRDCKFIASEPIAVYWDGVHGGGFINCHFSQEYREMFFLGFTNDDFTWDYNNDEFWSGHEVRELAYVVFYGNTFGSVNQFAIVYMGSRLLVKKNKAIGKMDDLVEVSGKYSAKNYTFNCYDINILDNEAPDVNNLLHILGPQNRPPKANKENPILQDWYVWTKYNIGRYIVKNNRIGAQTVPVLQEPRDGKIDGPWIEENNSESVNLK